MKQSTTLFVLMLLSSIVIIVPQTCFAEDVSSTIEIMPDGSIYPIDAPVQKDGNVYTLTEDINVVADGISIKKDDVIIDGAGHTLMGRGHRTGISIGWYTPSNASRQNITVKNLIIDNFEKGIRIENSSNNLILNCTVNGNPYGIEVGFRSCFNQIVENRITDFSVGIHVSTASNGSKIENNVLEGKNVQGIVIYYSQNQTVSQNNITSSSVHLYGNSFVVINNHFIDSPVQFLGNFHIVKNNQLVDCSLYVDGLETSEGLNDIDTSNTINGKPIYYLVDKKDVTITSDAAQITLLRCDNVLIKNIQISHNTKRAIYLVKTNNSLITQNTISSNNLGIHLSYSENNTITSNNISENTLGIKVVDSRFNQIFRNNFTHNNGFAMEFSETQGNNTIYHNNFIGNKVKSTDLQVSMPGYGLTNIANSNFWSKDGEGNFWSDYQSRYPNATEIENTGMGDTSFFINENNIDRYPFMKQIDTDAIPEFSSWIVLPLFLIVSLVVTVYIKKAWRHSIRKNSLFC